MEQRDCKIKIMSTYWTVMENGQNMDGFKAPHEAVDAEFMDTKDILGYNVYSFLDDDGMFWCFHENDVMEVNDDDFFSDLLATKDENCCDSPNIIINSISKDVFYVCRNCKVETNKDGYKI